MNPQTQLHTSPTGNLVEWDGVGPYPLALFPVEEQLRIAEAVAQPKPPARWIRLGAAEITSRAWAEWYRQRGVDPYRIRENIPTWMRAAVLERDGLICQLCGGDVEAEKVHLDHKVPHSLGGPDSLDNLQVSHALCNMRKGARVDG